MRLRALACLLLLATVPAIAQTRIEQRLTEAQMRKTGVVKLTPAELDALNRVLGAEQRDVEQAVERRVRERVEAPAVAIESTLPGAFDGWSPGQTLTLANGQTWRVTEGTLTVRRGARRDVPVRVAPGFLGAWYLKADGEVQQAKVKRID